MSLPPRVQVPEDLSPEERREFFETRGSPDPTPFETKPGYNFLLKSDDVKDSSNQKKAPLFRYRGWHGPFFDGRM